MSRLWFTHKPQPKKKQKRRQKSKADYCRDYMQEVDAVCYQTAIELS
jgi:hypothetical protein